MVDVVVWTAKEEEGGGAGRCWLSSSKRSCLLARNLRPEDLGCCTGCSSITSRKAERVPGLGLWLWALGFGLWILGLALASYLNC